jgi:uncharacterized protein YqjF (DUF2071 family)
MDAPVTGASRIDVLLRERADRQRPLAQRSPWLTRLSRHHALFRRWPTSAAALRRHVPEALELDTFDGVPWVTSCAALLTQAPLRRPLASGHRSFAAISLQTYVREPGGPGGLWFVSIDLEAGLAARIARRAFGWPCHAARLRIRPDGEFIECESEREGFETINLLARYRSVLSGAESERRSPLEQLLFERSVAYGRRPSGALVRAPLEQETIRLQQVEADVIHDTLLRAAGLPIVEGTKPVQHFCPRQDMLLGKPVPIG